MKRVKCINEFRDKTIDKKRLYGEVFEVGIERFKELSGANTFNKKYVEEVVESTNFEDMTVVQLKSMLDDKGIEYPKKAAKAGLIELLNSQKAE